MPNYVRCATCRKKIGSDPNRTHCRDCTTPAPAPAPRTLGAPCIQCGLAFGQKRRANASPFCSDRCRLAQYNAARRKPTTHRPCAYCGADMVERSTKQRYCSTACRYAARPARHKRPCVDCGDPCSKTRCRKCYAATTRIRAESDSHLTRDRREAAAPGLSGHRRAALLAKWKQQGRMCAYCDSTATTIDHVVPLVRGGTNHEGNLAPACRACNSRKGGRMVVEWRAGKRLSRMVTTPGWQPKARAVKAQPEPRMLWLTCAECSCGFAARRKGKRYCGSRCLNSAGRRAMRIAYRIKVGIDPDSPIDHRTGRSLWAA